jgi:hypothetical protein
MGFHSDHNRAVAKGASGQCHLTREDIAAAMGISLEYAEELHRIALNKGWAWEEHPGMYETLNGMMVEEIGS